MANIMLASKDRVVFQTRGQTSKPETRGDGSCGCAGGSETIGFAL